MYPRDNTRGKYSYRTRYSTLCGEFYMHACLLCSIISNTRNLPVFGECFVHFIAKLVEFFSNVSWMVNCILSRP